MFCHFRFSAEKSERAPVRGYWRTQGYLQPLLQFEKEGKKKTFHLKRPRYLSSTMELSSTSSLIASRWTGTSSWSWLTSCGGKQPQQMPMLTLDPVPPLPGDPLRPLSRSVSARWPMSFNAHRYGECTSSRLWMSMPSARLRGVKYHVIYHHVWWNGLWAWDTGTHCVLPSIPPLFVFSTLPHSPYSTIADRVQNNVFLAWHGLHHSWWMWWCHNTAAVAAWWTIWHFLQ